MDNPVLLIILALVALVLIVIFSGYNVLQRGRIKVQEAESGIDVALTKRFDVLTKMIEVVKGYTRHESKTLEDIVNLRSSVQLSQVTIEEKQSLSQQIEDAIRTIDVVAEQYPDLKASENFKHLQLSINDVEEHLQAARRVYNANVSAYNQKVKLFPTNMIANLFRFEPCIFFETEAFKRKDVEIKF